MQEFEDENYLSELFVSFLFYHLKFDIPKTLKIIKVHDV